MLRIKFRKTGKKHQKYLRLVVMEKRSKLGGKFVDDLGWTNPHEKTQEVDKEKVLHWIERGAKPTDTVHNFLVKQGVVKGPKIAVHNIKKKKEKAGDEKGEHLPAQAGKKEAPEKDEIKEEKTEDKKEDKTPAKEPKDEVKKETEEKKPE
ncbi:30S ribosomal protein S16 [bacterium]|nr:30S ribosomal protein S16 [bacterium]|tara:strand:- start:1383 stop:1832 length:450 start_codon:yes stop_codon:yes gene_type:complete